MVCAQCGTENPPEAVHCMKCTTVLTPPLDAGVTRTSGVASGWSAAAPTADVGAVASASVSALQPGIVLGNRFEIVALLGEGGMGAVYKVRDIEVDRFVALKIIRPELAVRPDILKRFKQELILARQVTHKNVIRIFDLGEADGVKFITMDFIEGRDLRSLLREKGKLEPEESAKIIAQVCRALDAAHSEGVVHRDLKPQNIMVDAQGRVIVMDFGIARSVGDGGGMTLTQTGALVGTPEYMSPEQAKGEEVDARSDLFTLGIIFYELLTGKTPYRADTAYAMLLKRTTERARPPIEVDSSIPPEISAIVVKCLEIDREQRYQTAREILEDLGEEARTGTRTGPLTGVQASSTATASVVVPQVVPPLQRYWKAIAGAVAALVLISVVIALRGRIFGGKASPGKSVSLAILPFHNASGDSSLDWLGGSLAEMLRTDVGQSSSLHTVSADRLHQILKDLQVSADTELDQNTVKRIAEFTNADRIVSGQFVKFGSQIRIDATLQDLNSQRSVPLKVEAADEKALLGTVDQLAKSIQDNLTLAPAAVEEMKASAFTPSSKSVEALREYSQGLELSRQGNHLQAEKQFESAVKDDPSFALAFSKLAQTYANLGYDKQAEQSSSKAVDLSENLPPAEKYWIQAANARIVNNYPKAIEAYESLAKLLPDDPQVQFDLGGLYEAQGQFDQAHDHFARVLQRDPKYVDALLAVGRVEIKRGNPQGSLDPLNNALSLAVQLGNQQEKATTEHALGVAYEELNKPDDALKNFQDSIDIKKQIGDKRGMAVSLAEIAQIQSAQGKLDQARTTYEGALKIQKDIGDKRGIGLTLMNLGDILRSSGKYTEALQSTKEALQIQQDLGNENFQALCLNNIGSIYFSTGQYDDAMTYYKQALSLREKLNVPADVAMTVNNIGETAAKMGHFDQALTSYLRALDLWRKADDKGGIALTSDGMATLFEFQGRFGAALNAQEEALKSYGQLQVKNSTLAAIQANYANALNLAGRTEESQKNLEEAASLAHAVQDDPLIAKIANFQGDRLFYSGDFKSARPLYDQALQLAARAKDSDETLLAKFNLARLSIVEGHGASVAASLRALGKDADKMGLRFLSAECSLYLGEALIAGKDYAQARQELDAVVRKSEDLGMKALLPQSHYFFSLALRGSGNQAEASRHLQEAAKLLEEMHKESKSDALMNRADLRPISEATRPVH